MRRQRILVLTFLALCLIRAAFAAPLGTGFTYQGQLMESGAPANGNHSMAFQLFDAVSGGVAKSGVFGPTNVNVTDGIFSVELDFGTAPFDGTQLWLEITVGSDTLSPRTKLTATPYALAAALPPGYSHVAIVSPTGGDYADPRTAMLNLAEWCGTLPLSEPCLVYIFPGEYVLNGPLDMKPGVHLRGVDRALVTLVRDGNGGIGVLNGDDCGSEGCDIADLTISSDQLVPSPGTIGIVSNGGVIRGERITVITTGLPDATASVRGIYSTADLTLVDLAIEHRAASGPGIQFPAPGATLELKRCSIFAEGLNSQTIHGVNAEDATVITRDCDINAVNSVAAGVAIGLRVSRGAFTDTNSRFTADADQVGEGLHVRECLVGDVKLFGTRMEAEPASFNAIGGTFVECMVFADNIYAQSRGNEGSGLSLFIAEMELLHSTVISEDFAIGVGSGAGGVDLFLNISWSLLRSPNTLVSSSAEVTPIISYSRLEDGAVGGGVSCVYSVDENLTPIMCP